MLKKVFILLLSLSLLFMPGMFATPVAHAATETIISSDFENNTLQGWSMRFGSGSGTVAVSGADAKSGNYSLLADVNRAHAGPILNVTNHLKAGETYTFSVWAKIAPSGKDTVLRLTMETVVGGSSSYAPIAGNQTVKSNGWTQFKGDFTVASYFDSLYVYLETDESASSGGTFYMDDFVIVGEGMPSGGEIELPDIPADEIPALKDVFKDHFTIGAAIEPYQTTSVHSKLLKKHYNLIVAENAMKPASIQPREGQFNWANADRIFQFAEENDMKVRFHTLVWHSQAADWMFLDRNGKPMVDETDPKKREENKEVLLQRMERHIEAIATRYKGRVYAYDVVNEVIADGHAAASQGLRADSPWYQITGREFIDRAFKKVREVDPDALLFINDYNTNIPQKRNYLYSLVSDLIADGIPIDGVGHQTHISISYPPIHEIIDSIKMFGELGLINDITELDMSIYTSNDQPSYTTIPSHILQRQADRYEALFTELKKVSEYMNDVTFWGVSDDHTWLHNFPVRGRNNAPFVFDSKQQAKPAYWAIVGDYLESDVTVPTPPTPPTPQPPPPPPAPPVVSTPEPPDDGKPDEPEPPAPPAPPVETKTFEDIASHWARNDIEVLATKGILNGVSDTHFAPERPISRAEFASILVRGLGIEVPAEQSQFSDIKGSEWFAEAIHAAVAAEIVTGFSDGSFQPSAHITREQMAAIIARAVAYVGELLEESEATLEQFDDSDEISSWATEHIEFVIKTGLMSGHGDGKFAPGEHATRAQAAAVLRKLLQQLGMIE